jgi:hypothetical protein
VKLQCFIDVRLNSPPFAWFYVLQQRLLFPKEDGLNRAKQSLVQIAV